MTIQRLILTTVVPTLLAGLVAGGLVLVVLNKRFVEYRLRNSYPDRRKLFFFFILMLLVMPIVFSLLRGMLLAPKDIAVYVEELLLSIVFVIVFFTTWTVIGRMNLILSWYDRLKKGLMEYYRDYRRHLGDEHIMTEELYSKTSHQQKTEQRIDIRRNEEKKPGNVYGNNGGRIYNSNTLLQREVGRNIARSNEEKEPGNVYGNNGGRIYKNGDSLREDT